MTNHSDTELTHEGRISNLEARIITLEKKLTSKGNILLLVITNILSFVGAFMIEHLRK